MCSLYELTTDLNLIPFLLNVDLPKGFRDHYEKQNLIRPNDPVLAIRQENGRANSSLMLWGLLPEWSKAPLTHKRPFNARAETLAIKPTFRGCWRHRRCLLPASGFFEKDHLIRRKDCQCFWLAGIWDRWLGPDGSEIESCCVITTEPNELIKPLHSRMPVIIPEGLEEAWMAPTDGFGLRLLEPLLSRWDPKCWLAEQRFKSNAKSKQLKFL